MSTTVTPNIATNAFPTIAGYLKYCIFETDGTTLAALPQIFAPAHPARTVSFPGLDRRNYKFKLFETSDPAGIIIVQQVGFFDFVPTNADVIFRGPEYIQVDNTIGIVNGATSFTMDGTGGKEDWRGFDVNSDRIGIGPMKPGIDYSWNKTTGTFTLLAAGDALQPGEFFKIDFDTITNAATGIPVAKLFSGFKVITVDTVLTAADAGKKIIIHGLSNHINITLPAINTVGQGQPFYFESDYPHISATIITNGGDQIIFGKFTGGFRNNITMGKYESITLYSYDGVVGVGLTWRVHEYSGNFLTAGWQFSADADSGNYTINAHELDGSYLNVIDYGRLYEYVNNLPPSQVVGFFDWPSNTTKFSLAAGGIFRIPDRRDLYERAAGVSVIPGTYEPDRVGPISGSSTQQRGDGYTGGGVNPRWGYGNANPINVSAGISINTGNSETTVKSYRIKRYVLC